MWTKENIPDQTGKIAIVTGANTGIGYQTALALYQAGAHVIIASRSLENASEALNNMEATSGKGSLEKGLLNLASLKDIQKFADNFIKKHKKLDILINNAGVMTPPAAKTNDGFELQFGVNFLGHFALTAHLYSLLKQAPDARVVTLSSGAYKSAQQIDFDNLRSEKSYDAFREYAISKLADMQFTLELQRRVIQNGDRILSLAAHPGVTETSLSRHMPEEDFKAALKQFGELMPAWQGALSPLFAATSPLAKAGGYYGPDEENELRGFPGPAIINEIANDKEAANKLWQFAENATGINFFKTK
ncbi:oxidoreductase [Dyadobacter subterraneus]|uniref:SDR family NAD(P)-dependent oxidoreductase n=1 Tax=Dyadobacter subterraneus TaxID=2773304 RepID=A0ABR9W781_9BACT|nr:oxidoreductase [Dyadobacter subterraneus]MBE9461324.1 SDR family NAD(P)-dependent oxidoreductase [Dyadobacter subterraneus]